MNAPTHHFSQWLLLVLLLLGSNGAPLAREPDIERAELETVLRQLDALERHADNSAALPSFDRRPLPHRLPASARGYSAHPLRRPELPGAPARPAPRSRPMLGEYIGEPDAP